MFYCLLKLFNLKKPTPCCEPLDILTNLDERARDGAAAAAIIMYTMGNNQNHASIFFLIYIHCRLNTTLTHTHTWHKIQCAHSKWTRHSKRKKRTSPKRACAHPSKNIHRSLYEPTCAKIYFKDYQSMRK